MSISRTSESPPDLRDRFATGLPLIPRSSPISGTSVSYVCNFLTEIKRCLRVSSTSRDGNGNPEKGGCVDGRASRVTAVGLEAERFLDVCLGKVSRLGM